MDSPAPETAAQMYRKAAQAYQDKGGARNLARAANALYQAETLELAAAERNKATPAAIGFGKASTE